MTQGDTFPSAQVSESNGEISCSIEETNRIRAQLGLKPLKLDNGDSEKQKRAKAEAERERRAEEESAQAVQRRIQQAREKRESRVTGRSIAEEVAGTEVDETAAWIQRSRRTQEEMKHKEAQAAQAAAAKKQAEYDARHLQGLAVTHKSSAIGEGETVILTLKDSSILDGNALNEEGDQLENVKIAEEEMRQRARDKSKQKTIYDEAEEEALTGKKNILSKYDDSDDEAAGRGGHGMVLDARGQFSEDAATRAEQVKRNLEIQAKHPGTIAYDLSTTLNKTGVSDYMTQEEAAVTFKKTGKKKKRKIRKKKGTAAGEGDADGDQGKGGGKTLADELERQAEAEQTGDGLVSRSAAYREKREEEAGGKKETQQAYLRALRKSANQNAALKDDYHEERAYKARLEEEAAAAAALDAGEDEDGADLAATLARTRRLAQQADKPRQAVGDKSKGGGISSIAEEARRQREEEEAEKRRRQEEEEQQAHNGAGGGAGSGSAAGVVFTEMSEFVREHADGTAHSDSDSNGLHGLARVKGKGMAGVKHEDGMDVDDDTAPTEVKMEQDGGGGGRRGWTAVKPETGSGEGGTKSEVKAERGHHDDATSADQGVDGTFGRQKLVSGGLAATLSLLKSQGDLNQAEMLGGRTNDRKHFLAEEKKRDEDGDLRIDYYDKFGRTLTPKEAYRELCYKFHGIAPSKNKQAKILKEYQKELKQAKGALPSSLDALRSSQAETGNAFVVLQGGSQYAAQAPPLTEAALKANSKRKGDDLNGNGGAKKSRR